MDKEKKNRSGSQSNAGRKNDRGETHRTSLPGAKQKSNRQTGGHERDESHGAERYSTKKNPNSI